MFVVFVVVLLLLFCVLFFPVNLSVSVFLFLAPVKLFLHFLQNKYQWPDDGFEKAFEKLAREDVTSVGLLAECWNVVKKRCFPDARMREIVVMELRKQNMIYADGNFIGLLC